MPRILKNSKGRLATALLIICVVVIALPISAFAYNFFNPGAYNVAYACPELDGFTLRITSCIRETFVYAVAVMLEPISEYIADTVAVLCVIAIALWAMLMISGKHSAPLRDLSVLAVKMGAVFLFTWNFGGLFESLLDAMDDLLGMVVNVTEGLTSSLAPACTPTFYNTYPEAQRIWVRVDCAVISLVGGIAPVSLTGGLIGFLVASLFSGSVGVFIAILGFLLILQLLIAIARAMYIYLTAYMAFSLMVIISPFFIPLILFRSTYAYFEQWVKLTMGFIFQPIFLFAFLAMLLTAFNYIIYDGPNSIYNRLVAVSGVTCSGSSWFYTPPDVPMVGDRLLDWGVYGVKSEETKAVNFDPKRAFMQLGQRPYDTGVSDQIAEQVTNPDAWNDPDTGRPNDLYRLLLEPANYFKIDVPATAVDWHWLACINGYDEEYVSLYLLYLLLAFLMALITTYIFMTMLDYLPYIGSGITGDVLNMPVFGAGKLASPADKLGSSVKSLMGGS